jgi:NADH-quinone oxidoreductase subunit J
MDQILFYFFGGLAVIGAILVVTSRSAVYSAVFLITTLLATAGIFLTLGAEFLFVVQIILYVGGIMVLFVFVIMLVNLDVALHQLQFNRQKWVAGLLGLVLGAELLLVFYVAGKGQQGHDILNLPQAAATQLEPNTQLVGQSLFTSYLIPFEIASILLLVALVGAVVMGKKRI